MITAAGRAKRAEYQRDYRRRHPEKVKQWQENHWNKKAKEKQQASQEGEANNGQTPETDGHRSENERTNVEQVP